MMQLLGWGQDAVSNCFPVRILKNLALLPWEKLRIPIVSFQIVTQYINITGFPVPDVYGKFLAWTDVLNLNLGWFISLGCLASVTFYQKLLITTLTPFIIAAALLCTHTVVRLRNPVQCVTSFSSQRVVVPERTARLEVALAKHHTIFLTMTFLIYSTVSTAVFQTFSCDRVDENTAVATRYLRADYSIQCDTAEHKLYKVYAAVMIIIYPIGIPVLYTWLLWRQRHKLTKEKDESGHFLDRQEDISLQSTKFLWKTYVHQMYYWEVAECIRRLLLTGAIVFIAPGTTAQAAIACILAVFALTMASYFKPHNESLDGMIYTVGALIIFLSMFMSLAMKADVSKETNESQNAFGVVLVMMNALMIGVTAVKIVLVSSKAYIKSNISSKKNNNDKKSNDNSNNIKSNDNNSSSNQRVTDEEQQQSKRTKDVKF
jgi:Transient receptor potential (TRP) ion channel